MIRIDAIDSNSTTRDGIALLLSVFLNGIILYFSSHSSTLFSKTTTDNTPIEVTRVIVTRSEVPQASAPPSLLQEAPKPQVEKAIPQIKAPRPNLIERNQLNKKSSVKNQKIEPPIQPPSSSQTQESSETFAVPSVEAQVIEQIKPEIPFEVRSQDYKSYVRVKVEIDIDGTSSPSLKTSSGNEKVDAAVLSALKKWKWRPALLNGSTIKSVRYFRFEFEVK